MYHDVDSIECAIQSVAIPNVSNEIADVRVAILAEVRVHLELLQLIPTEYDELLQLVPVEDDLGKPPAEGSGASSYEY